MRRTLDRLSVKSVLAAGAALALTLTGVTIASIESSSAATAGCHIRTDLPNAANDAIVGRSGCSNTISGTGRIKENRRYMMDDVVGEDTFDAGVKMIYGSCGNGKGNYYSEFSSSSGAFAKSSSVLTCK